MDISAQLAVDLAALSQVLDGDTELETTVRDFATAAKLAITSYLGMTVTVIADGHHVGLDVPEHARAEHEIATSLLIPLADVTATETGGSLVLFAATPGAFVDLAADLTYALQVGPDTLVLDAHLTPSFDDSGLYGLAGMTHINQAIGILIERGHSPDAASAQLHHLASQAHTTVREAARQLIHAAMRRPGFEPA